MSFVPRAVRRLFRFFTVHHSSVQVQESMAAEKLQLRGGSGFKISQAIIAESTIPAAARRYSRFMR